jgi:hypothetical protein
MEYPSSAPLNQHVKCPPPSADVGAPRGLLDDGEAHSYSRYCGAARILITLTILNNGRYAGSGAPHEQRFRLALLIAELADLLCKSTCADALHMHSNPRHLVASMSRFRIATRRGNDRLFEAWVEPTQGQFFCQGLGKTCRRSRAARWTPTSPSYRHNHERANVDWLVANQANRLSVLLPPSRRNELTLRRIHLAACSIHARKSVTSSIVSASGSLSCRERRRNAQG